MLPLGEVLLQAGRLLRRYPAMFLPVAAGAIAARILLGDGQTSVPMTVAFWLLNLALTAGLLSMVRSAHQSESGAWEAFLVGVGRYFAPILAGSIVQVFLLFVTLLPIVAWLRSSVGIPDVKALLAGNLAAEQIDAVSQWAAALCAWGAVWGIVYFFLALWQQAVVVQSAPWLRAWWASASFVRSHWLRISCLLALQGVLVGLCIGLIITRLPLLPELGAIGVLLINCYFSVATMVVLLGPIPAPKGENVDATA